MFARDEGKHEERAEVAKPPRVITAKNVGRVARQPVTVPLSMCQLDLAAFDSQPTRIRTATHHQGAPPRTGSGQQATTRIRRTTQPGSVVGREGGDLDAETERSIGRARSGGRSLDERVRTKMEGAFHADFSGVRVHTGSESSRLSTRIRARAFTVGQDIFFNGPMPSGGAPDGQRLLAHELTHTLQQGASTARRSGLGLVATAVGTERIQREDDDDLDSTSSEEDTDDRSYATRAWDGMVSLVTWSPWVTGSRPTTAADQKPTATTKQVGLVSKPTATTGQQQTGAKPKASVVAEKTTTGGQGKHATTKPTPHVSSEQKKTNAVGAGQGGNTKSEKSPSTSAAVSGPAKGSQVLATQSDKKKNADSQTTQNSSGVAAEQLTDALPKAESKLADALPKAESKQAEGKQAEQTQPTLVKPTKQSTTNIRDTALTDASEVLPRARRAVEAAAVRSMPNGGLKALVGSLEQQRVSSKTDWKTFAASLASASKLASALLLDVEAADKVNADKYQKARDATTLKVEDARKKADAHKIDKAALETTVAELAKLEQVKPQVYLPAMKQLKVVKQAVDDLLAIDKVAAECSVEAGVIVPAMNQALLDAATALDTDPDHSRDSKYWEHLVSAEKYLKESKAEVDAALNKPYPIWAAMTPILRLVATRTKRIGREIAVAPHRPENLVGWNFTSAAIAVQDPAAIDGDKINGEQAAVTEALEGMQGKGKWFGGGGKWNTDYGNIEGRLPSGSYVEYYVRPPADEEAWGKRRLVKERKSGRIYYTWTHYGDHGATPEFVLLRT